MIAVAAALGCLVGMAITVVVTTTITRALIKQHEQVEMKLYEATQAELRNQVDEAKKLPLAVARVYNPLSTNLRQVEDQVQAALLRIDELEKHYRG